MLQPSMLGLIPNGIRLAERWNDAELRRPLKSDVLKLVATDRELNWLGKTDASTPWNLLLFSAKESVFKTWFPLMRTWLGFEEAEIDFEQDNGTFRATLTPASESSGHSLHFIRGRYRVTGSHVLTCAFIEV